MLKTHKVITKKTVKTKTRHRKQAETFPDHSCRFSYPLPKQKVSHVPSQSIFLLFGDRKQEPKPVGLLSANSEGIYISVNLHYFHIFWSWVLGPQWKQIDAFSFWMNGESYLVEEKRPILCQGRASSSMFKILMDDWTLNLEHVRKGAEENEIWIGWWRKWDPRERCVIAEMSSTTV